MTARIPTRSPRAAWSSPPDPDAEQARADVATARAVLSAVTRRVALRQDGASALHSAEYALAGALKNLDRLGGWAPPTEPEPDGDGDPPSAA